MNFLKSQTEKVSRFLMSGMWKLSLDVEIEPDEIDTAGSFSTAGSISTSRLNFYIPDI